MKEWRIKGMTETTAHVVEVTDDSFERQVLRATQPVVVDFWAPWCPPCLAIAPILAELARDYAGKLTVAKLNVDENPHCMQALGIFGAPTLVLFKNGQEVGRLVGARRKQQYQAAFNGVLASQ
jgi:thioredoxin 1